MSYNQIVGVVLFSMFMSACASNSTFKPRNDEKRRVQDEANEFYSALRDKNAEKIWQLSSPFLKKDNQKEEYVKYVGLFLAMTDFDYSDFSVVYIGTKLAVTQARIQATFPRLGEGNVNECERIVWLRFPEGWRFHEPNRICSYMPDKKRIEFLTKNIPDR